MLYEITSGRHRVCALIYDRDFTLVCPAWKFMEEQNRTASGQVKGMKAYFTRYAKTGRSGFTTDILHHANVEHDILEFIKGQMRVFCFIHGTDLILTHGILKKTQRADKSEVAKAIRCKEEFLKWKESAK